MFSCKCLIHNNGKSHLTAFDVKSDTSIFLGYLSVSKAYRVFISRTLSVEDSVHVAIYESSIVPNAH